MVSPIRNGTRRIVDSPKRKKAVTKEIDVRIKKAVKPPRLQKATKTHSGQKLSQEKAYLAAERAAAAARFLANQTKRAAVTAQKKAFQAQRAHMMQQAAAARRARAAEKTRKAAERAALRAVELRRMITIKAYIASQEQKKKAKKLKKYFPKDKKKKDDYTQTT